MMDTGPHPGPPVRAVLVFTVRPGDTAEFERAWADVADWAGRWSGCVRQTLCRTDAAEPTYVITSDWVDRAAFRAFERSEEQDTVTAELRRLRRTARMELHTMIAERSASGPVHVA
ncbi:antibiotic biosynthesis monooxygenase [Spongiactinospora gelatinilytica]|uniref:Antibiotic biosynthesis monooxygenase n=1 Tax=Spongiactinospora gelatinilytica TaxID=2666298 RepID=A0A2W2FNY2_9ACTN|nr:antibiotic biosynthesis monooxygenase family protein [Spongiactinospora gelatinilytica]PZG37481.1 antibiotic biosynthesis monooxygenase [Spongiactinospora gelatinilytica]